MLVTVTSGDITINTMLTNDDLYNVTHGSSVDTTLATQSLTLFFYMEERTFGTTTFYNVPSDFFPQITTLDSNGNKTIHIEEDTTTTGNLTPVQWVCVTYTLPCPICHKIPCEIGIPNPQFTSCTPIGGWIEIGTGGGGNTGGGSTGGGGNTGGGGTSTGCLTSWYSFAPCTGGGTTPPTPPDTTSVLTKLKNYSLAINSVADSIFQLSMIVPLKEYCAILVKKDTLTYLKNIRTDNDPDQVNYIWFCQNGETLLGQFHTHQENTTNLNDRPGPSHEDIVGLNANGHQGTKHFMSLIECGNVRFALVIEDPVKANLFFRNFNSGKFDIYEVYMSSLNNNPIRFSNYQQAGLDATIAVLGNSSVSGIAIYKSTNTQKTDYEKKN